VARAKLEPLWVRGAENRRAGTARRPSITEGAAFWPMGKGGKLKGH
jgi:hypothetical protein